jgi:hypothetical protein
MVCFLTVSVAWSKPVLLMLDRNDLTRSTAPVQVIREMSNDVIVTTDQSLLAALNVPYKMLDADYLPHHYLFVRRGQPLAVNSQVLWDDNGRLLVRVEDEISEWTGGQSPLEKAPAVTRESRRPSHLDDPALDAWLTNLAGQVNADSLLSYVTKLASWNRYARYATNDTAAAWIRAKFLAFGYDSVYYHTFTASGSGWSRTDKNIIAVLPGTASPDSIVMIGAHMDATSQSPSTAAPGADDNGSGTAGMLEAARLLAGQSFTHTIMFVAFNAEEQGLQGSAALASTMATQGRRVIGLLNMDMIGYYEAGGADLWIEGFRTGTVSQWLINLVNDNCLQFSSLVPYIYPNEGFGSDHESFHDAGFTAILAIENEYENYSCYHNTCDLPARVTASFMRNMASVVIVTGAELAVPLGSGSISGHVILNGGSDYSGVRVSVAGGAAADTTDVGGVYQIAGLMPGTYSLAFSKSGYVSDTLRNIVVTAGANTPNHDISLSQSAPGSISGTVTISGGSGIMTNVIVYDGSQIAHPATGGGYSLSPLDAGSHVITAALNGYALASQTVTLASGQALSGVNLTLYPTWDLEASNYNLTANTGWAWGTDATTGAHSGTKVWGTVLGGNYINCADYQLQIPAVSLANLDSARLTFWHWFDIEPNGATQYYDGANVSVSPVGSSVWTVITPDGGYPAHASGTCNPMQNELAYAGSGTSWRQASFSLNAYLGQTLRVRFHLGADGGVVRRGWYLDDLVLAGWHSVVSMPPEPVMDLTLAATDSGMVLSWTATTGATQYRIYRGTIFGQSINDMQLLNTQTATVYNDTTAGDLPMAFYIVVAAN